PSFLSLMPAPTIPFLKEKNKHPLEAGACKKAGSALGELRRAAGGLEAVLSRLVARNPCIYLVFELRHPQFPHSLTTDEILFLPFISPRLRIL
ncbi:MAG: hypothetical protein II419_01680, partial [Acidaminococcaceae bacterium]|nr:hypothetical protein [Acidaminococcaceae bacterium]